MDIQEKSYLAVYKINDGPDAGDMGSFKLNGTIGGEYNIDDVKVMASEAVHEMLREKYEDDEFDFTVRISEIGIDMEDEFEEPKFVRGEDGGIGAEDGKANTAV